MIYDVKHIVIPDNYVIVKMTYKQLRALLKGIWKTTRIYRTPDGALHAFLEERNLIYISNPEK